MRKIFLTLIFFCLLNPFTASAHIPNQSYIFLRVYEKDGIDGRFEINVRELNKVFGFQLGDNITKEDVAPYIQQIQEYLLEHTYFESAYGAHKIQFTETETFNFNLGDFVLLSFHLENSETLPEDLTVQYDAVFEKDDSHRGFLIIEYNWKAGIINNEANIALDFSPTANTKTLSLAEVSVWKGFVAMVKQGVWHIWIGIDHILFLLALILPSVVRRTVKNSDDKKVASVFGWEAVKKFRPAFIYIVKVITFFTIAHTITLSLASLQIINLPSQLVESVIALSIGLAAYHNIRPIFKGRDWVIAFVFGLFHGFGFASVLGDLGLQSEFLTLSLLGFNVGVEIGQLVIIAIIFPFLFLIRNSRYYPKILVYGSIFLIVVSLYWAVERIFGVELGADEFLVRAARKITRMLGGQ